MRSPAGLQCCLFRVGQRASPASPGTIHKYTINSVHCTLVRLPSSPRCAKYTLRSQMIHKATRARLRPGRGARFQRKATRPLYRQHQNLQLQWHTPCLVLVHSWMGTQILLRANTTAAGPLAYAKHCTKVPTSRSSSPCLAPCARTLTATASAQPTAHHVAPQKQRCRVLERGCFPTIHTAASLHQRPCRACAKPPRRKMRSVHTSNKLAAVAAEGAETLVDPSRAAPARPTAVPPRAPRRPWPRSRGSARRRAPHAPPGRPPGRRQQAMRWEPRAWRPRPAPHRISQRPCLLPPLPEVLR